MRRKQWVKPHSNLNDPFIWCSSLLFSLLVNNVPFALLHTELLIFENYMKIFTCGRENLNLKLNIAKCLLPALLVILSSIIKFMEFLSRMLRFKFVVLALHINEICCKTLKILWIKTIRLTENTFLCPYQACTRIVYVYLYVYPLFGILIL